MQTLQRRCRQTRARPRKKACAYGVRVSGATIFAYVGGNPLSYTDPNGLTPVAGAWAGAGAGAGAGGLGGVGGSGQNQSLVPPNWTKPSPYLPTWNWDGVTWPDWATKKSGSAELEQCKQDADDALDRAYDYCKALGATYNDYRTRKACEENAFRKYTKRLQECEQQCK